MKNIKKTNPNSSSSCPSETCYQRLFETAQYGILILDAKSGEIIDVNPFLLKLLGYSLPELLGKKLWEIGVLKDAVISKAVFKSLQTKGYIRYQNLPLQTNTGCQVNVEFICNVYLVGQRSVIQCNIRDISDRKKTEEIAKSRTAELERLTKSQNDTKQAMLNVMEDLEAAKILIELEKVKDEAMLASIGEGLIAVDNKSKVMMVNKAAEKMFGWTCHEMVDHEITQLPLANSAGQLLPFEKRPTYLALTTGKIINVTHFFIRKDKTKFPLAITVSPIKLNKKIIGAIIICRDVTREREIDQAKSEFVSLASHQLRTPLGISKWYLEAVMAADYFKTAPQVARNYLSEIYKNNERLLVLVRDLLSISRIDQGKVRNSPQLVDISQLLKNVTNDMSILAQKNNIKLELKIKKSKLPEMFIDDLRLQEVIENLITNAINYSHESGVVQVTADHKDKQLIIEVKDNGIGISAEDQKKIFTKFFRAENAVTKNVEGSGLGLYVVKSYVEGWGGTIVVQSTQDKGSTFTISLPIMVKQNQIEKNLTHHQLASKRQGKTHEKNSDH